MRFPLGSPPSSSSRARSESVTAPNVAPFDLIEWATRRNVSGSDAACAAAQLTEHRWRFLEERGDEFGRELGARRRLEFPVGVEMSMTESDGRGGDLPR